jgi:hypothetical protein
MLRRSHFLAPIFEGFVASEVAKLQAGAGRRRELYYFRDQQGLEVDLLVPLGEARLALIEAKASASAHPGMGWPLERLARAARGYGVQSFGVHQRPRKGPASRALRPGVAALAPRDLQALPLGGIKKARRARRP